MKSNRRDNKHRPYDIFCAVAVNERFFMQCGLSHPSQRKG